jgi:hypothetical protein
MYKSYSDFPTLFIANRYLEGAAQVPAFDFAVKLQVSALPHFSWQNGSEIHFLQNFEICFRGPRSKTAIDGVGHQSVVVLLPDNGNSLQLIIVLAWLFGGFQCFLQFPFGVPTHLRFVELVTDVRDGLQRLHSFLGLRSLVGAGLWFNGLGFLSVISFFPTFLR